MRINNNLMAMNTHRQLGVANGAGAKSMERLSSGFRINRAGDDAAGLAISEKMRGQIRGLTQASSNSQDAISLIQTSEGALNETHAILQRMRELAVQSSTDTNTGADRANIQDEIDELATEITRISTDTEFNTMKVLDGSFEKKKFHIGSNKDQNITFDIGDMGAKTLGIEGEKFESDTEFKGMKFSTREGKITIEAGAGADQEEAYKIDKKDGKITITFREEKAAVDPDPAVEAGEISLDQLKAELQNLGVEVEVTADFKGTDKLKKADITETKIETEVKGDFGINVSSQDEANTAITTVNSALERVSKQRSKLGAVQNRLEHTIKNLDTSAENLQASESRIRDVDMAKEMMEQTKNSILQQASTAMLGQANQAPQTVLQLLN